MSEFSNDYPFISIHGALEGFVPPEGTHDPHGAWKTVFHLHNGSAGNKVVGSLRIERRPKGDTSAMISLRVEKTIGPPLRHRQTMQAELECGGDPLSTPKRWEYSVDIASDTGEPFPDMAMRGALQASGKWIQVEKTPRARRIERPESYTVNWALFDAVQRLPQGPFAPLRFAMFDDFDQIKLAQTLSYRESRQLSFPVSATDGSKATRDVTLHGYDHTGSGLEPWTYWVDGAHRLLFAICGTGIYIRADDNR